MDFYDHNIVSIGHSELDENWIIKTAVWDLCKNTWYNNKQEKIRLNPMSIEKINEKYANNYNNKGGHYCWGPSLRKKDLKFSFWHIFAFNPLTTMPVDTSFHVRKYQCIKNDCVLYNDYSTPNCPGLDELEMVLQFTIPAVVKDIDLPRDHLQAILEILSLNNSYNEKEHFREPDVSIPFSGPTARKYYLQEFILRCEKVEVIKARSLQPDENPHVSCKKKSR